MSKPDLTVIKGGMAPAPGPKKEDFHYAYVTDTRLMGVVGLYVQFKPDRSDHYQDWHQFFYLDAEEYGFETFAGFRGGNREAVAKTEASLFGGLGGRKVRVDFEEASAILKEYVKFNEDHGLEMPAGKEQYGVLLEGDMPDMTGAGFRHIMSLQCAKLSSRKQLVNYFVMRCFGKDLPAAKHLSDIDDLTDIYSDYPAATLCKNTIDKKDDGVYLCESLIEYDDKYALVVTEITVENMKVTKAVKCSGFTISSHEAAIALSKSEYVSVYDIAQDSEGGIYDLSGLISGMFPAANKTDHENGRLFMIFHNNNSHVKKQVYRLNDDISGIVFLSVGGQLLLAAYDEPSIIALEKEIYHSPADPYLSVSGKFKFKEPVLFEFVQNDFIDFDEFLDYMGAF
ncbi:MAG: hypothetical protein IKS63_03855 [Firmicutes bacterium]|nr:hypothetical protein [Bacillota bacterium]